MFIKTLHIIFIILFFSSCSPVHHPTASNLAPPKATRHGIPIIHERHDFSQVRWWEKMHDPALNRLIRATLTKNYQLKNAKANLIQARAKLQEAHYAWLPTLNLDANGFVGGGWDSNTHPQGPLALTPALSKITNIHFRGYYTGFTPQYSINLLHNIQNNKFAKASLNVQRATYQSVKLSLIGQMAGSYFMLIGQRQQLHQQQETIHDLKILKHLETIRYHDGASDLSTVLSIDKKIANNEANLRATESSLAEVENAIQLLLNHNPNKIITHQKLNQISIKGLIPSHLPSAVLRNRPDMMMSAANLRMTEANLGLAYSNFFPTISVTGLLGVASFELSHLISVGTNLWLAQAAASVPALNGVTYAQIKEAKAGYYAAYYSYLQTIKSVFSDVDNSLTAQDKNNAAYEAQLKAYHAAKKSYDLMQTRYEAGAKDYRDLINEKINFDAAAIDLTLAKMQQLDSMVTVYQALAGGYKAFDCQIK